MKEEKYRREHRFLRLMQLVIRHGFHHETVEKKARPLLGDLKGCGLPGGSCRSGAEVIPYEHLWEQFLEVLASQPVLSGEGQDEAGDTV